MGVERETAADVRHQVHEDRKQEIGTGAQVDRRVDDRNGHDTQRENRKGHLCLRHARNKEQGQMPGGMGSGIGVSYTDTTSCNSKATVTCTMITASYSFSFVAGYLGLGTKTLQAKAQAVRY